MKDSIKNGFEIISFWESTKLMILEMKGYQNVNYRLG